MKQSANPLTIDLISKHPSVASVDLDKMNKYTILSPEGDIVEQWIKLGNGQWVDNTAVVLAMQELEDAKAELKKLTKR